MVSNNSDVEREQLYMDAWLHGMNAVWSLHKYVALIAAGTLSGWYVLFIKSSANREPLLAALLLFFHRPYFI